MYYEIPEAPRGFHSNVKRLSRYRNSSFLRLQPFPESGMFHYREEFDPSGRIRRVQPPLYLRPAYLSLAQRTAGAARKGEAG